MQGTMSICFVEPAHIIKLMYHTRVHFVW